MRLSLYAGVICIFFVLCCQWYIKHNFAFYFGKCLFCNGKIEIGFLTNYYRKIILYPSISLCSYAPISLCAYVHMSLCPNVPMSLCLYVSMPLCLYVSMSLCPYVLMSLCPYVPMSLYPYVTMFL